MPTSDALSAPPPRTPQWLAPSLTLGGGLLVLLATFLPWRSFAYDFPGATPPRSLYVPASAFFHSLDVDLHGPYCCSSDSLGLGTLRFGLFLWGLPLLLLAIGLASILVRRGSRWRAVLRGACLVLVVLGVGFTIYCFLTLSGYLVSFSGLAYVGGTGVIRTWEIGALVVLLGYGCVLVGMLASFARPSPPR